MDTPKPNDPLGHFFAAAAEAMRRILIENARRKRRVKHGGELRKEALELELVAAEEYSEDLLSLNDALEKLTIIDPDKARFVELRYFAGLTNDQASKILGISPSTGTRIWNYARAWLRREIRSVDA